MTWFALTPLRISAADCQLLLTPWVNAEFSKIPPASQAYLETKLTQMITENGIGIGVGGGQFCLMAKCDLLSKEILGGAPIVQTQRLSITFIVADMIDGKIIASTNIEVVSSGNTDVQTYNNAIRRLNAKDRNFQDFIRNGKEKIMAFYNSNGDAIIKKAQNLAAMNSYEEALFLLVSIPECSPKYDQAMAACRSIYQSYIDRDCLQNLMVARTRWAAAPNEFGAEEAAEYMSAIEPASKCYGDVIALYNEMKNSVKEDWKYEFKNYDERALERERIKAYREVGVAFGKGQQPSTTIIGRLR